MQMKIVGCLICVIVLNCNSYTCGNVEHRVETARHAKISKNVTIHRKGYGRHLGLLSHLKSFHHRKHINNHTPYVISKHWRASFEFELQPHAISEHEISSTSLFPTHSGGNNSGVGSNSIESIFHFGSNDQQGSVTIGGSNQIVKGPDERDEIPIVENNQDQVVHKDAILVPPTEVEEKSERVLRHAIQPRSDEQSDEDENVNDPSTTPHIDDQETDDTTIQSFTVPKTTLSTETMTETATTVRPESSSTSIASSTEHVPVSSTTLPSEWLGYYDFGIHKPAFIQNIEFTTAYPPQLTSEDIRYVTQHGKPFKPSLPDYYKNEYSAHFFVPLSYFKR